MNRLTPTNVNKLKRLYTVVIFSTHFLNVFNNYLLYVKEL